MDVGAAGPLSGALVTLPLLVLGLQLSDIQVVSGGADQLPGIVLGESILFKIICWLTVGFLPDNYNIIMHPIAFAGWIGLLVTNINLIPVGQLDGGHVSYALFGDKSQQIAKVFYLLLIIFGLLSWYGWLVWVVLLYFMGFVHPPPLEYWVPLDPKRRLIGYVTIVLFILTFMPAPFIIQ